MPKSTLVEVSANSARINTVISWLGATPHKLQLWTWQYKTTSKPHYIMVADTAGELIGFNGVMRCNALINGAEQEVSWSCDFIVCKTHRSQGYGGQIKILLADQNPTLMAFGISDLAVPVHKKAGWLSTDTDVYLMVLCAVGNRPKALVRRTIQYLRSLWKLRVRNVTYTTSIEVLAPVLVQEISNLWHTVKTEWGNCIVRDEEYLNWRYCQIPDISHQVIALRTEEGSLRSCLIVRAHPWETSVVEYIGSLEDEYAFNALVTGFYNANKQSANLRWLTTIPKLAKILNSFGFHREQSVAARFHVQSRVLSPESITSKWTLSGGDSDSDLIVASRLSPQIKIREWDEEQFANSAKEWSDLCKSSSAHALFMSWEWQFTWWKHFGQKLGKLRVIVAEDLNNNLIGLAVFVEQRSIIPSRTILRSIGSLWRARLGMRTEYQSFVCREGCEESMISACLSYLKHSPDWQEIIIGDVDTQGPFAQAIHRYVPTAYFLHNVQFATEASYRISTRDSLDKYKANLSKSTRRRLFHLRKKMQALYRDVRVEYCETPIEVDEYMAQLNALHSIRWNSPVFEGEKLAFNRELALLLLAKQQLRFSRIRIDGEVRSVLLNYRAGRHEINIQSGFDQNFDTSLPLGYIHIGLVIEDCFESNDIDCFDLLAGRGKNSNYKAPLATESSRFHNIHIIRTHFLAMYYSMKDYGAAWSSKGGRGRL